MEISAILKRYKLWIYDKILMHKLSEISIYYLYYDEKARNEDIL